MDTLTAAAGLEDRILVPTAALREALVPDRLRTVCGLYQPGGGGGGGGGGGDGAGGGRTAPSAAATTIGEPAGLAKGVGATPPAVAPGCLVLPTSAPAFPPGTPPSARAALESCIADAAALLRITPDHATMLARRCGVAAALVPSGGGGGSEYTPRHLVTMRSTYFADRLGALVLLQALIRAAAAVDATHHVVARSTLLAVLSPPPAASGAKVGSSVPMSATLLYRLVAVYADAYNADVNRPPTTATSAPSSLSSSAAGAVGAAPVLRVFGHDAGGGAPPPPATAAATTTIKPNLTTAAPSATGAGGLAYSSAASVASATFHQRHAAAWAYQCLQEQAAALQAVFLLVTTVPWVMHLDQFSEMVTLFRDHVRATAPFTLRAAAAHNVLLKTALPPAVMQYVTAVGDGAVGGVGTGWKVEDTWQRIGHLRTLIVLQAMRLDIMMATLPSALAVSDRMEAVVAAAQQCGGGASLVPRSQDPLAGIDDGHPLFSDTDLKLQAKRELRAAREARRGGDGGGLVGSPRLGGGTGPGSHAGRAASTSEDTYTHDLMPGHTSVVDNLGAELVTDCLVWMRMALAHVPADAANIAALMDNVAAACPFTPILLAWSVLTALRAVKVQGFMLEIAAASLGATTTATGSVKTAPLAVALAQLQHALGVRTVWGAMAQLQHAPGDVDVDVDVDGGVVGVDEEDDLAAAELQGEGRAGDDVAIGLRSTASRTGVVGAGAGGYANAMAGGGATIPPWRQSLASGGMQAHSRVDSAILFTSAYTPGACIVPGREGLTLDDGLPQHQYLSLTTAANYLTHILHAMAQLPESTFTYSGRERDDVAGMAPAAALRHLRAVAAAQVDAVHGGMDGAAAGRQRRRAMAAMVARAAVAAARHAHHHGGSGDGGSAAPVGSRILLAACALLDGGHLYDASTLVSAAVTAPECAGLVRGGQGSGGGGEDGMMDDGGGDGEVGGGLAEEDGNGWSSWDPELDEYRDVAVTVLRATITARHLLNEDRAVCPAWAPPACSGDEVTACVALMAAVFERNPAACDDLWALRSAGHEVLSSLLTAAWHRFPLDVTPVLTLARVLSASPTAAGRAWSWLVDEGWGVTTVLPHPVPSDTVPWDALRARLTDVDPSAPLGQALLALQPCGTMSDGEEAAAMVGVARLARRLHLPDEGITVPEGTPYMMLHPTATAAAAAEMALQHAATFGSCVEGEGATPVTTLAVQRCDGVASSLAALPDTAISTLRAAAAGVAAAGGTTRAGDRFAAAGMRRGITVDTSLPAALGSPHAGADTPRSQATASSSSVLSASASAWMRHGDGGPGPSLSGSCDIVQLDAKPSTLVILLSRLHHCSNAMHRCLATVQEVTRLPLATAMHIALPPIHARMLAADWGLLDAAPITAGTQGGGTGTGRRHDAAPTLRHVLPALASAAYTCVDIASITSALATWLTASPTAPSSHGVAGGDGVLPALAAAADGSSGGVAQFAPHLIFALVTAHAHAVLLCATLLSCPMGAPPAAVQATLLDVAYAAARHSSDAITACLRQGARHRHNITQALVSIASPELYGRVTAAMEACGGWGGGAPHLPSSSTRSMADIYVRALLLTVVHVDPRMRTHAATLSALASLQALLPAVAEVTAFIDVYRMLPTLPFADVAPTMEVAHALATDMGLPMEAIPTLLARLSSLAPTGTAHPQPGYTHVWSVCAGILAIGTSPAPDGGAGSGGHDGATVAGAIHAACAAKVADAGPMPPAVIAHLYASAGRVAVAVLSHNRDTGDWAVGVDMVHGRAIALLQSLVTGHGAGMTPSLPTALVATMLCGGDTHLLRNLVAAALRPATMAHALAQKGWTPLTPAPPSTATVHLLIRPPFASLAQLAAHERLVMDATAASAARLLATVMNHTPTGMGGQPAPTTAGSDPWLGVLKADVMLQLLAQVTSAGGGEGGVPPTMAMPSTSSGGGTPVPGNESDGALHAVRRGLLTLLALVGYREPEGGGGDALEEVEAAMDASQTPTTTPYLYGVVKALPLAPASTSRGSSEDGSSLRRRAVMLEDDEEDGVRLVRGVAASTPAPAPAPTGPQVSPLAASAQALAAMSAHASLATSALHLFVSLVRCMSAAQRAALARDGRGSAGDGGPKPADAGGMDVDMTTSEAALGVDGGHAAMHSGEVGGVVRHYFPVTPTASNATAASILPSWSSRTGRYLLATYLSDHADDVAHVLLAALTPPAAHLGSPHGVDHSTPAPARLAMLHAVITLARLVADSQHAFLTLLLNEAVPVHPPSVAASKTGTGKGDGGGGAAVEAKPLDRKHVTFALPSTSSTDEAKPGGTASDAVKDKDGKGGEGSDADQGGGGVKGAAVDSKPATNAPAPVSVMGGGKGATTSTPSTTVKPRVPGEALSRWTSGLLHRTGSGIIPPTTTIEGVKPSVVGGGKDMLSAASGVPAATSPMMSDACVHAPSVLEAAVELIAACPAVVMHSPVLTHLLTPPPSTSSTASTLSSALASMPSGSGTAAAVAALPQVTLCNGALVAPYLRATTGAVALVSALWRSAGEAGMMAGLVGKLRKHATLFAALQAMASWRLQPGALAEVGACGEGLPVAIWDAFVGTSATLHLTLARHTLLAHVLAARAAAMELLTMELMASPPASGLGPLATSATSPAPPSLAWKWVDSLRFTTCRASEALELVPPALRQQICDMPHSSATGLSALSATGLPKPPSNAFLTLFNEVTQLVCHPASNVHGLWMRWAGEGHVDVGTWRGGHMGGGTAPARCTTSIKSVVAGGGGAPSRRAQPLIAFSATGELVKLVSPHNLPSAVSGGGDGRGAASTLGPLVDGAPVPHDERGLLPLGRNFVYHVDALASALGCPTTWLLQLVGGSGGDDVQWGGYTTTAAVGDDVNGSGEDDGMGAATCRPPPVLIPATAQLGFHTTFTRMRLLWSAALSNTLISLLDTQLSNLYAVMQVVLVASGGSGSSTGSPAPGAAATIPPDALTAAAITALYRAAELSTMAHVAPGAAASLFAPGVAALLEAGLLLLGRTCGIASTSYASMLSGGGGVWSRDGSLFGGTMYQVVMQEVARQVVLPLVMVGGEEWAPALSMADEFAENTRIEESTATGNFLHMLSALAATLDHMPAQGEVGPPVAAGAGGGQHTRASGATDRARSLAIASSVLVLGAMRASACRYWAAHPELTFMQRPGGGGEDGGAHGAPRSHLPPIAAPAWKLYQQGRLDDPDVARSMKYYTVLAAALQKLVSHACAALIAAAPHLAHHATTVAAEGGAKAGTATQHVAGTLFMNAAALLIRCLDVASEYTLYARSAVVGGAGRLPDVAGRLDVASVVRACAAVGEVFAATTGAVATLLHHHEVAWLAKLRRHVAVLAPPAASSSASNATATLWAAAQRSGDGGSRRGSEGEAPPYATRLPLAPTVSEARAFLSTLTEEDAELLPEVSSAAEVCDGWALMAVRVWERVSTCAVLAPHGVNLLVASGALTHVMQCQLFHHMDTVMQSRVAAGLEVYPYASEDGSGDGWVVAPVAALPPPRTRPTPAPSPATTPATIAAAAAMDYPLAAMAGVLEELHLSKALAFAPSPFGTGPTNHRGYTHHKPPHRCSRHQVWCDVLRLLAQACRDALAHGKRGGVALPPGLAGDAIPDAVTTFATVRDAIVSFTFARRTTLHTALTSRHGITFGYAVDLHKTVDVMTGLTFGMMAEAAAVASFLSALFITWSPSPTSASPFLTFVAHCGATPATVITLRDPTAIQARPHSHFIDTLSTLAQYLVRDVSVMLGSGKGGKHPPVTPIFDTEFLMGEGGGEGPRPSMPSRGPSLRPLAGTGAAGDDMGSVVSDRPKTVSSHATSTRRLGRINERDAGEAAREVLQGYLYNLHLVELSRDERAMAMRKEAAARIRAQAKKRRFLDLMDSGRRKPAESKAPAPGAEAAKAAPTTAPTGPGTGNSKTTTFGEVGSGFGVAGGAGGGGGKPLKSIMKATPATAPGAPPTISHPPARPVLRTASSSSAGGVGGGGTSSAGFTSVFGGVVPASALYRHRRGRVNIPGAVAIETSSDMLEAGLFPALVEGMRLAVNITTSLLYAAKLTEEHAPPPSIKPHPALSATVLAPVAVMRASSAVRLMGDGARADESEEGPCGHGGDGKWEDGEAKAGAPTPRLPVLVSTSTSRPRSETVSTTHSFTLPPGVASNTLHRSASHGGGGMSQLAAWYETTAPVIEASRMAGERATARAAQVCRAIAQEAAKASRATMQDSARRAWDAHMAQLEAARGVRAVLPFAQPRAAVCSMAAAADRLLSAPPAIAHLLQAITFTISRYHRITAAMGVSMYDLPDDFDMAVPLTPATTVGSLVSSRHARLWHLSSGDADALAERMFHIHHPGSAIHPITVTALRTAARFALHLTAQAVDGAINHARLDPGELLPLLRDVRFVIGDGGLGHMLTAITDSPEDVFAEPAAHHAHAHHGGGGGLRHSRSQSRHSDPLAPTGGEPSSPGLPPSGGGGRTMVRSSRSASAASGLHPLRTHGSSSPPLQASGSILSPTTTLARGASIPSHSRGIAGHIRRRHDTSALSTIMSMTGRPHRSVADARRDAMDAYAATRSLAWLFGPHHLADIYFLRVVATAMAAGLSARMPSTDDAYGDLLRRLQAVVTASHSGGGGGAGTGGGEGDHGHGDGHDAKRLRASVSATPATAATSMLLTRSQSRSVPRSAGGGGPW